ncbi:hypothetical protein NQ318_017628, partial [Aromia moschata]
MYSLTKDREVFSGVVAHVQAIVRGTALLPCDLTASAPNDSVVLVVWYKDEHTPIYRDLLNHSMWFSLQNHLNMQRHRAHPVKSSCIVPALRDSILSRILIMTTDDFADYARIGKAWFE